MALLPTRVSPLIVHPAIWPLVAVTFPISWASEAVIWPLDFNINLSFVEFIWVEAKSNPPIVPPLNNTSEPVTWPLSFNFNISPTDIVPSATANPPTSPPSRDRADAVTIPWAFTLNEEAEINKSWPVAEALIKKLSVDKASLDKLKAAILPPWNNTCEPVISPLAFTLKLLLDIKNSLFSAPPLIKKPEPVIASCVIPNPPRNPLSASILPMSLTLPSTSKWNLLELISKLPSEPLINLLASPKKNLGVWIPISLPLIKILPSEPLIKLSWLPKKKAEELNTKLNPLNCILSPCESPARNSPSPDM